MAESMPRVQQLFDQALELAPGERQGFLEVEAAVTMGVSERTLRREWAFARAWLFKELGQVD